MITSSRKWAHHIAWVNYHTSDYIIAYIDTFNTELITLCHTSDYIITYVITFNTEVTTLCHTSDYIMTYINTFNTEVITFNTEVITLCHASDHIITYINTSNTEVITLSHMLYYYMRNFCNLIGLEQWYFSLIWNTYMWKLQTFCG